MFRVWFPHIVMQFSQTGLKLCKLTIVDMSHKNGNNEHVLTWRFQPKQQQYGGSEYNKINQWHSLISRLFVCLFLMASWIILKLCTSVRHSWHLQSHLTSITTMPGVKGLKKDEALITVFHCVQASSYWVTELYFSTTECPEHVFCLNGYFYNSVT